MLQKRGKRNPIRWLQLGGKKIISHLKIEQQMKIAPKWKLTIIIRFPIHVLEIQHD